MALPPHTGSVLGIANDSWVIDGLRKYSNLVFAIAERVPPTVETEFRLEQLGFPYNLENPDFKSDDVMSVHVLVERVAMASGIAFYK